MKLLQIVGVILTASVAGESVAGCGDPPLAGAALTALLEGNTVCVSNGNGGWENQEQHHPGGSLVDYKRGNNPFDPTEVVGSWSIARGNIRYTYGGATRSYTVHDDGGGNYTFCGPATIDFTVRAGLGSC